jgi:hypothetical protein
MITIKNLNDDLKENINNNLEFADTCVVNLYPSMLKGRIIFFF